MLAAEARALRILLERIVDGDLGLEEILQRQRVCAQEFPQGEGFDRTRNHWTDPVSMGVHSPRKWSSTPAFLMRRRPSLGLIDSVETPSLFVESDRVKIIWKSKKSLSR